MHVFSICAIRLFQVWVVLPPWCEPSLADGATAVAPWRRARMAASCGYPTRWASSPGLMRMSDPLSVEPRLWDFLVWRMCFPPPSHCDGSALLGVFVCPPSRFYKSTYQEVEDFFLLDRYISKAMMSEPRHRCYFLFVMIPINTWYVFTSAGKLGACMGQIIIHAIFLDNFFLLWSLEASYERPCIEK
jgi:hypothetical protein